MFLTSTTFSGKTHETFHAHQSMSERHALLSCDFSACATLRAVVLHACFRGRRKMNMQALWCELNFTTRCHMSTTHFACVCLYLTRKTFKLVRIEHDDLSAGTIMCFEYYNFINIKLIIHNIKHYTYRYKYIQSPKTTSPLIFNIVNWLIKLL